MSIELKTSRLKVEIAEPGEVYRGSRYDWTSFVTSVVLDDKYQFCGRESLIPGRGSGGLGLCGEFQMTQPGTYEEAEPGHQFVKIGVGLLTRNDDDEYRFSNPFEVNPSFFQVNRTQEGVVFTCKGKILRGIGGTLRKVVSVAGDTLTVASTMTNSGERRLQFSEYNHNYIHLGGESVGPGYVLTLPFIIPDKKPRHGDFPANVAVEGNRIVFLGEASEKRGFYFPMPELPSFEERHWTMNHGPAGLSVTETVDRDWSWFALYGTSYALCPEIFLKFDLAPGDSASWTRQWTFSKAQP